MQTPSEVGQRVPWSSGQKTSGLGPKCEMSLMSKWLLGTSNIQFEQWDCQTFKQLMFWEQQIMNLTGFVLVLVRAETVTTRQTSVRWQTAHCGVSFVILLCDLVAVLSGETGQGN